MRSFKEFIINEEVEIRLSDGFYGLNLYDHIYKNRYEMITKDKPEIFFKKLIENTFKKSSSKQQILNELNKAISNNLLYTYKFIDFEGNLKDEIILTLKDKLGNIIYLKYINK